MQVGPLQSGVCIKVLLVLQCSSRLVSFMYNFVYIIMCLSADPRDGGRLREMEAHGYGRLGIGVV